MTRIVDLLYSEFFRFNQLNHFQEKILDPGLVPFYLVRNK